jgi:hypothetical protein
VKRSLLASVILAVLVSPVLLVRAAWRAWNHLHFLRAAQAPAVTCECGRPVSLVGIWRCSCGFTYRGHLLRVCPVCGRLPQVVRCYGCGITIKLPEPQYG